ncbi:MAG: hypothetical protein RRB13_10420 [bacterium]|nr:hypothetical protein [bacterium]
MGSFVGNVSDFKKYIGPRLRNVVNNLARPYRIEVGQCQICRATQTLEAAHIQGRERTIIIDELLENYLNGEIVTIDLEVFENQFFAAHQPLNESILILCRACHREYDNQAQVKDQPQLTNEDVEELSEEAGYSVTNREITDDFREFVSGNLPWDEIENLLNPTYSRETFLVHFPILKEVPANADQQRLRELARDTKGYGRWSPFPIARDGRVFLVTTQWFDRCRSRFLAWKMQIENR